MVKERTTVSIDKDLHREARIEAAKRDMTVGEFVTEAIRAMLDKSNSEQKKDKLKDTDS